jgi:hypothetical protein
MLRESRSSLYVGSGLLALVFASGACSGNSGNGSATGGSSGPASGGSGGSQSSTGRGGSGGSGGTSASGGVTGTGGSSSSGGVVNTGGTTSAGESSASGGTVGSGGSSTSSGVVGSGGASAGGGASAKLDAGSSGGAGGKLDASPGTDGTSSSGGVVSTGGTPGTGGAPGTGGSTGAVVNCPNVDTTEFGVVSDWLNNKTAVGALPTYAYSNIKSKFPAGAAFDKLACSIAMSCQAFAPSETDWLRKCEAVITSAIVAESSYNPASVVVDAYATRTVGTVTANDPTVGLLQIRFTSTVHDYNYNGPMAKMAAIGCSWPAALAAQADTAAWWATNGGTTYLSFMQDVACNIALATWYYFYNATGNGGANAVWISGYCAGQGIAGNMVVGLLSHLMGGAFTRPADANNAYPWGIECCSCGNPSGCSCTGCTGRIASFMGIGTASARPSPDPFQEVLIPEPTKYCK